MALTELLLGSASPRRKELLFNLGFSVSQVKIVADESHPSELVGNEIAEYIAIEKAKAYSNPILENQLLITADTVVWHNRKHLAKPKDASEAKEMLRSLSNQTHEVFTAVALRSSNMTHCFSEKTKVKFRALLQEEIDFYIAKYKPFDKAGAYGIQEWIGMIGIERIEGCYYNVVGLPLQRLHAELKRLDFHPNLVSE